MCIVEMISINGEKVGLTFQPVAYAQVCHSIITITIIIIIVVVVVLITVNIIIIIITSAKEVTFLVALVSRINQKVKKMVL